MKASVVALLSTLLSVLQLGAQFDESSKTQHHFARSYLGLNLQIAPSGGRVNWGNQSAPFPQQMSPRLSMGGMHFWGHLDFNMNFSLYQFGESQLDADTEILFRSGGDLSARYYPWRLHSGKLRPFAGASINIMGIAMRRAAEGIRERGLIRLAPVGGLSWQFKGWQIDAEALFLPQRTIDFYSSRLEKQQLELPPLFFSIGLRRYFDVTLREAEGMESGKTQKLEQELQAAGKLNSLSIGFAPSTAFFLQAPSFSEGERASLPRHQAKVHLELGLGYLWHKAGLHAGLSYRNYASSVESYELEHIIRREVISLEGFKFLWNYKGFAPYIGPSISWERWAVGEFDGSQQLGAIQRTQKLSVGLLFGWDILASPLETWVLRTNLRYYPFQKINGLDGEATRVDQFEFNFIQVVFYPQRMWHIPKAKKDVF